MQAGKASLKFKNPAIIASAASVVGKKEGEGPLASYFDVVEQDDMFGADSWEQAESAMQKQTADLTLEKGDIRKKDVRYLYAGDLLGQLIATSFGTVDLEIPLFGLYGACSTIGEALGLGAMAIDAKHADCVMAMASSHFATAEKEFRFPLAYGSQRPYSTTWTVTGCGALVLKNHDDGGLARITGFTTGRLVDMGIKDSMNMGAAMAPAAWQTICQHLEDFGTDVSDYDQIITGDLGEVGSTILLDFMRNEGKEIDNIHTDCGLEIYSRKQQDVHSGGSGCGCAAVTLCSYILPKIKDGTWKRVLFLPTGALLSNITFNQGESIPCISHGVVIESLEQRNR